MNTGRWLAASISLNLGLASLIAWRVADRPAVSANAPEARPTIKRVVETNVVVQPGAVVRHDWRAVESADYRQYIANLRGIGCPEETIRDIIILDLNKQFIDRWRAAHPPKPFQYWDTSRSGVFFAAGRNTEEREREQLQLELNREKRELVRELLGVDLAEELAGYHMSNSRADLENMWTFLPPAKRGVVEEIRAKYNDLEQGIRVRADPDGRLSPELQQAIRDLRARREAELAQAMTPGELEQYQLRMSSTAANVRLALSAFEPTEEEYRRVFPLRRAYDEIYAEPGFDRTDPEQLRQRTEAYRQMEEQMRAMLTPDRFAEYQRSRENDYRDAHVFAKVWGLPRETVATLYQLKQAAVARMQELRADQALDANARQSALAAVAAEVETRLKGSLGERVYNGYLRGQGAWVRNLRGGNE
ncbi:MAG: hypothetical protein AB1705_07835 [Verrucomicrobiota bacterium]